MKITKLKPGQVVGEFQINGKKVILRTLKKDEDVRSILRHINSLIRERAYIVWQKPFTMKEEMVWFRRNVKENREGSRVTVITEVDGKITGCSEVWRVPQHAKLHIANIGVALSSERGKGIGYRLMCTLESLAKKYLGSRILMLDVYERNAAAIKLYEKCGFREIGRVPKGACHYGSYIDLILMVKELWK